MAWKDVSRRFTFGGRIAAAVGGLLLATLALSLVGVLGTRHGVPLHELLSLEPALVFRGEVWRLVTWAFVEPSPLGLLFTCFMLYWLGNDLAEVWSNGRILKVYLGIVLAAAAPTCLVALADGNVRSASYLGAWPIVAALTVAWGLYFPEREIRLFFLITLRGLVIAWLTVAIVVVFAVYAGWEGYLPALFGIAFTLAWVFRGWLVRRVERARDARRVAARTREVEARRAATAATASVIRDLDAMDEDDDPPPMPPEIEGVLDRIASEVHAEVRAKRQR